MTIDRTLLGLGNITTVANPVWENEFKTKINNLLQNAADLAQITGSISPSYIILEDQKPSGTGGGTSVANTWTTRTLNVKSVDTGLICTLNSNQFNLPAGTYRIKANATAYASNGHQIRLRNITDNITQLNPDGFVIVGTLEYSNNNTGYPTTRSFIENRFTLTSPKTFEIQHWVAVAQPTIGFGVNINTGETSIFTRVAIEREN